MTCFNIHDARLLIASETGLALSGWLVSTSGSHYNIPSALLFSYEACNQRPVSVELNGFSIRKMSRRLIQAQFQHLRQETAKSTVVDIPYSSSTVSTLTPFSYGLPTRGSLNIVWLVLQPPYLLCLLLYSAGRNYRTPPDL